MTALPARLVSAPLVVCVDHHFVASVDNAVCVDIFDVSVDIFVVYVEIMKFIIAVGVDFDVWVEIMKFTSLTPTFCFVGQKGKQQCPHCGWWLKERAMKYYHKCTLKPPETDENIEDPPHNQELSRELADHCEQNLDEPEATMQPKQKTSREILDACSTPSLLEPS